MQYRELLVVAAILSGWIWIVFPLTAGTRRLARAGIIAGAGMGVLLAVSAREHVPLADGLLVWTLLLAALPASVLAWRYRVPI